MQESAREKAIYEMNGIMAVLALATNGLGNPSIHLTPPPQYQYHYQSLYRGSSASKVKYSVNYS